MAIVPRSYVLARLNLLLAIRQLSMGKSQAAVDTWIAGIRFAEDLSKGGSLVFALTSKGVMVLEMRSIAVEVKKGLLNNAQKKQLYAAISKLPEGGFDWGKIWEIEDSGLSIFFEQVRQAQDQRGFYEKILGQAAPKDCVPPNAQQMSAYHDYMRKVADALRLPIPIAKTQIEGLVADRKKICSAIEVGIPSPERTNEARQEIASARADLLAVLLPK